MDICRRIIEAIFDFFWQMGVTPRLYRLLVYTENTVPPCISWEKLSFILRPKKKYLASGKTNTIFPDNTRKVMFQRSLFEKVIFSKHLKKISYFHLFFLERSSFIFHPRGKIIFWGKRNITFPDDTRNIIFQRNFFGKTIFSGLPEKENMVFRAAYNHIV